MAMAGCGRYLERMFHGEPLIIHVVMDFSLRVPEGCLLRVGF